MLSEMVTARIHELAEENGNGRENLLQLLETLNRHYNYLDEDTLNEVAKIYQISQTEVYSIASFYHLLNIEPVGEFVIHLCKTISCELQGKDKIVKALEAELGIKMGETTADKKYTLKFANCMGACDTGPAMLINDDLYSGLTPSMAVETVRNYK